MSSFVGSVFVAQQTFVNGHCFRANGQGSGDGGGGGKNISFVYFILLQFALLFERNALSDGQTECLCAQSALSGRKIHCRGHSDIAMSQWSLCARRMDGPSERIVRRIMSVASAGSTYLRAQSIMPPPVAIDAVGSGAASSAGRQ